jgi:hypothetical protein
MATHRVYRDAEHPTRISFSTIPQPSMAATKEDK